MVDPELIADRLGRLDAYLKILRRLARYSREDLTGDPLTLGGAERFLHKAIESCLDIANHIVATERLRSPSGYADIFAVLAENGILPEEFLPIMQDMARFRNRLVHLYWEIESEIIYRILQSHLDDFERFRKYILIFLKKEKK